MKPLLRPIIYSIFIIIYPFFSSYAQTGQNNLNWKYKTNGKIIGTAAVQNANVYFGSSDGMIHALNARSGKKIWQFKTGGEVVSRPVLDNNHLYILSGDGTFYALNANSGNPVWTFKTGGEHRFIRKMGNGKTYRDIWDYYLSGATLGHGYVYFGSSDGNVYCLNARTGKMHWKFKTGNVVHATPVISGDSLFVGSFDGYLYSLNAENGQLLWKFHTIGHRYFSKGSIQRGAAIYKGGVYFGSRDFNLYVLDKKDGRGFWNYQEPGSWIISTPTIYRGQVYFGTSDSHAFYSMNADHGRLNWKSELNMRVYGSATGYGDHVYFGCFNGFVYGINIHNGNIEWRFQTDGSLKNYPTIYNEDGTFRSGFSIYGRTLKETQEKEAQIQSMGSIMATPVIQNNVIFFGSTDSTFYAVKLPE